MPITVQNREQVASLYVAMFGRAPDGEGFGFWVNELGNNGKTFAQVADAMYATSPARAYFPSWYTNQEIISSFYTNVLGRTADADGLAFWTAKLNAAGATPGKVIAEMISVVETYSGTDAAGLTSKALFVNKGDVAQAYAEANGSVAGATSILSTVTADAATATAAQNAIKNGTAPGVGGATGQTFTLTKSVDAFSGTSGADTFSGTLGGSEPSLNAGDTLDGLGGADTLRISSSGGAAVNGAGFTAKNIETISVTAALTTTTDDTTINLAGASGYSTLESSASASDVVFSNVASISTLKATNTSGGTINVNYNTTTVAGSSDTQNITLDGATTGIVTVAGVETVSIDVVNNSVMDTGNVFAAATKLNLSGTGTLTTGYTTASANLKTVDASKMTGALTLTVANANLSITGGTGNDVFTFANNLGSDDTVNGGDGTDTISVNAASTSRATLTSIEALRIVADAAASDYDMDQYSGIATVDLRDTDATGSITLSNLSATQVVSLFNTHVDSVTGTLKSNTSADTLALTLGGVTLTGEALTFNQHETINITSNKSSAGADNAVVTLNATSATTINISGAAATSFGTNLDTATNSNVNAGSATGALTVIFGASEGNQKVTGGTGNDSIQLVASGFDQLDTIAGGDGTDALYLSGAGTVQSTAWANVTGVENIRTTDGAQLNLSNTIVDQATGGTLTIAGRTIASSAALATTTDASAVTSTVTGTIRFLASDTTTVRIDDFTLGAGAHNLSLGAGADEIRVTATNVVGANDTIVGGAGTDTLTITSNATVNSHDLKNVSEIEAITLNHTPTSAVSLVLYEDNFGVSTSNTITVNGNNATVGYFIDARNITSATKAISITATDMDGADSVYGGAGNDLLRGADGTDQLIGGAGADTLEGGAGADTLTGGAGIDNFLIVGSVADNGNVISDFATGGGGDRLDLGTNSALLHGGATLVGFASGALGNFANTTGFQVISNNITTASNTTVTAAEVQTFFGATEVFFAAGNTGFVYVAVDNGVNTFILALDSNDADKTFTSAGDAVGVIAVLTGITDATTLTQANVADFI